jgi:flavodoxin
LQGAQQYQEAVVLSMNCLLIVFSYHHKNTEKVANVLARILDAQIKTPRETDPEELQQYDLVGFGSGIYGEKHHRTLLELTDEIPEVTDRKAFLFSTSAIMGKEKVAQDHLTLREKLQSKGYTIIDEFACKGFNTNSFLRYLGGMNKGRPNADDLKNAEEFAQKMKQNLQDL